MSELSEEEICEIARLMNWVAPSSLTAIRQ